MTRSPSRASCKAALGANLNGEHAVHGTVSLAPGKRLLTGNSPVSKADQASPFSPFGKKLEIFGEFAMLSVPSKQWTFTEYTGK